MHKSGELSENEYSKLRPKNAAPSRAHGLPKIHKQYDKLPKFRPIVNTVGSPYYSIGQYLAKLLNPLTHNELTLKDSFDAAEKIRQLPNTLFDDGYMFVSFDVESLFTSVPLTRTIDIILKRVYEDKLLTPKINKRNLKKLIYDTCTKTSFLCNGKFYDQINGVSMGSSLAPVLANIIMTELEEKVIQPSISNGKIRFYGRYVDDTLLVVKPDDISEIHELLNKFDPNLKFTVDTFENEVPHFLDLKLCNDGLEIYRKDTNTGLYTNFNSYVPWHYKIAWIKSLVTRAKIICSKNKLKREITNIKKFISWNGFPKSIGKRLIDQSLRKDSETEGKATEPQVRIWFRAPYFGDKGEQLIKSCIKKLKRHMRKETSVYFYVKYDTTKLSYFTNSKDMIPTLSKSFVVYHFSCPGCDAKYIGKTERTLFERTNEHSWTDKNSAIKKHIDCCPGFQHILDIKSIDISSLNEKNYKKEVIAKDQVMHTELVRSNICVIDKSDNWNLLSIKESLKIKECRPSLNIGLKCKDLCLF